MEALNWICPLLTILWMAAPCHSQLSPGPLSKPHYKLEGIRNCGKCHGSHKNQQVDEIGCNNCHTLIREQLKSRKGLHGRNKYIDCGGCHPEHISKTFKILNWRVVGGIKNFDHGKMTGYCLKGAHTRLECRDCHKPDFVADKADQKLHKERNINTTYLGLSRECLGCHEDEHGKGYNKTCTDCHNRDKWKPAPKFNHDTMTGYKLKGSHRKLKCADCHKRDMPWRLPQRLRVTAKSCLDCHKDYHKGKYSRRCLDCHNQNDWHTIKKTRFNHDKTDYPLTGRHTRLECKACHPKAGKWQVAKYEYCLDCHQDGHPDQIKYTEAYKGCEDCHTTKGFSPSEYTVQEHAKTDFKLDGAHLASACIDCHKPLRRLKNTPQQICKRRFAFDLTGCSECHTNPHGEGLNAELDKMGCEYCHVAAGWDSIAYEHENCGWPLEGRHEGLNCIQCHKPKVSKFKRSKPWLPQFGTVKNWCADCHKDIHQGQLEIAKRVERNRTGHINPFNSGCATCHTSTDWMAEKFDHNRDSEYKLEGAHTSVTCDKCHPIEIIQGVQTVRYRPLKHDCRDCHGQAAEPLNLNVNRSL